MQGQDFTMHRLKSLKERNDNLNKHELELINQYTRRPFTEDEVYTFSVTLCDNEIDRDFERFSDNALEKLSSLFKGVTGITDHDPKAKNQTARIYDCITEKPQGQYTSDNKPYMRLKAFAYIPKAKCSDDIITQIESGIKKEVSVGCSVAKKTCSVCGSNIGLCSHSKGHYYDGRLCFAVLEEPTDAYDWSFVAVPAQKAAGVTKNYKTGVDNMDIEKRIFSGGEQTFTADEMMILAEKLRSLNERAADGDAYRTRLVTDINKMAAIAVPALKKDTLSFITSNMSAVQLEDLCHALTEKAAAVMPVKPQLSAVRNTVKANNNDYKNI